MSNNEQLKEDKVIEELEKKRKLKREKESLDGGPLYESEEPRQGDWESLIYDLTTIIFISLKIMQI